MLRKPVIQALVLTAAVLAPGLCRAEALEADAQSAASQWDAAYNRDDMEALGKLYTPDAIVVTKGATQTRDGIPKFFAGLKSKGWDDHKTTVRNTVAKDNLLIVSGRWEMTGPVEGGAKKKFEGNWVNVLERQKDGWRTVLHTWN